MCEFYLKYDGHNKLFQAVFLCALWEGYSETNFTDTTKNLIISIIKF
jgi:hypothetical protein